MKLRNKKTGEIGELKAWNTIIGNVLDHFTVVCGEQEYGYETITGLMGDWEEYEPLIKDEKIRKAVRAWAEANDIKNVAYEDYDDENSYFIDRDYEPQIWFPKKSIIESPLDDGSIYTITELCGEE